MSMGIAGMNPLYLVLGLAVLGLAPFLLMLVTSYVKIVVVTSLVRNALGVHGGRIAVIFTHHLLHKLTDALICPGCCRIVQIYFFHCFTS